MEALVPWLLVLLSALSLACLVLYLHLRQAESMAQGRHELFNQELERAQTVLESALDPAGARGSTPLTPDPSWPARAIHLHRVGMAPAQIGRLLGVPAGEVELIVGLARNSR